MAQRRNAYPQTELQRQEQIIKRQDSFGGGINVDVTPTEIGDNELADAYNVICYNKYIKSRPGCSVMSNTNCLTLGTPYGTHYVKPWNKIVAHFGTKLYLIDSITFAAYAEVCMIDGVTLAASQSRFETYDDIVIVFNNSGIFKIADTETGAYCFQVNRGQPIFRLTGDTSPQIKKYGRNRTYAMSRIIGSGCLFGDRRTHVVEQETASVLRDSNRQDATKQYFDKPIGDGFTVVQRVVSTNPSTSIVAWNTYTAGGVKITIGSVSQDIFGDFSSCILMTDVAAVFDGAIKSYFQYASCKYDVDTSDLIFTAGTKNGDTIAVLAAPTTGVNLIGAGMIAAGTVENYSTTEPQLVTGLLTPTKQSTHFSVYGSKNIGSTNEAVGNLEDTLIWLADIPIIKTSAVVVSGGGTIITSSDLFFDMADIGTTINLHLTTNRAIYASREIESLSNSVGSGVSTIKSKSCLVAATTPALADGNYIVSMGAARAGTVWQIDDTVRCASGVGLFNLYDFPIFGGLDNKNILFLGDGSIRTIKEVVSSEEIKVVEQIDYASEAAPGCAAIGILNNSNIKVNVEIKKDSSYLFLGVTYEYSMKKQDGSVFVPGDEGFGVTIYYYDDVVWSSSFRILHVTEDGKAILDAMTPTPGLTSRTVISLTNIVRNFNDYFSDDVISGYDDDPAFVLQTRYHEALPSTNKGCLVPGFLAVGEQGNIHYSAMIKGREYQSGFYRPDLQKDIIKDTIQRMKSYANNIVLFGKSSTWSVNSGSASVVKTTAIGEDIFVLPSPVLVDNKGLVHVDSLQDISLNQSIVLASDYGVWIFNGNQYSQNNLAEDKISSLLHKIGIVVTSSYDAIGGYLLYCSDKVGATNTVNSTDGIAYRLAVMSQQGSGWTRWGGVAMAFPFVNTSALTVEDARGLIKSVILDSVDGKWYQINTYTGPTGSGLVESDEDKGGAEIACSIKSREYRGSIESTLLEHMESHIALRPKVKGGTYRNALSITTKVYKDDDDNYSAQTEDTPIEGDIVYDRRIEAKRLQDEYLLSAAGFIVAAIETIYLSRDTAGATAYDNRVTSEMNHQESYANGLLWITRGREPLLDRQSGMYATGNYSARITGPDGNSSSGLSFTGNEEFYLDNIGTLDGDFTIQFGFKFDASDSVPVVNPDDIGDLDGTEWEGMEFIGSENTGIAFNRAAGRFDFLVDGTAVAYLNSAGWTEVAPSGSAVVNMGIYFDQERACFLFLIDGSIVGILNCQTTYSTTRFITSYPASNLKNVWSYIYFDTVNNRICFYAQNSGETGVTIKAFIDANGLNNGAPV